MVKKRALIKDIFRDIGRSKGRFMSILLITALGTAFFAGVRTSAPVMEKTFNIYAEKTQFMDIRVLSTVGFEQADIDAIAAVDGVNRVQPGYQIDSFADVFGKKIVVSLISAGPDDAINKPEVIEGRLPLNEFECAVDISNFRNMSLGSVIELTSGTDDPLTDVIKSQTLTVVGKVRSPLYITRLRGSSKLGSGVVEGFLLLNPSAYTLSVYTDAYLRITRPAGAGLFDDAYDEAADAVIGRAENVGLVRGAQWKADTLAEAEEKLADGQKEYDDNLRKANKAFAAAQEEIDDNWAVISLSQAQITAARQTLAQSESQGREEIRLARETLAAAVADYEAALAAYLAQKDGMTPEAQAEREAELSAWLNSLIAQEAAIDQNEQTLLATIAAGTAILDQQQAALNAGKAQLVAAQKELDKNRAKASKAFAEARAELDEAAEDIKGIPDPKWYVLGHEANAGFTDYESAADRLASISKVFPAFFFFIATLVCLTTMTRMVDEQRTNMGILKALGYTRRDIAFKYLLYASSASILGSVLGVAIGMWLFPQNIFRAYSMLFSVPGPKLILHVQNAALAIAFFVSVTIASTLIACYNQLHDMPAALMQPRAPKIGKKILLEKIGFLWRRFNFSMKVTARNLFRYKKRLFMTLIGIAGCTGLLLTGYGIRDSIGSLAQNQYGRIFAYHISVNAKEDLTPEEQSGLAGQIAAMDVVVDSVEAYAKTMDFGKAGSSIAPQQATVMVFRDDAAIQKVITLQTRVGHKPIALPQSGAVISEKLSMELGIRIGDSIVMIDGERRTKIPVVAITENYIRHFVYMSEAGYAGATGMLNVPNQIFVNVREGADLDNVSADILLLDNVTQARAFNRARDMLKDTVKGLNSVVLVLIVTAAALAFVVMYNLTNINIGERIREIATLRVLGFTKRELAQYVFRENILLSLLGIVMGTVVGFALHRYVMTTVEVHGMMFARQILPLSYLISYALTLLFTMLVNIVMLPKLFRIDMVESLKTVE
jgi:putative ABC transport system permease protein